MADKQKAVFWEIWKKAARPGVDKVRVPMSSERAAQRVRFGLYNSVRGIRDGKVECEDLELVEALGVCTVYMEGPTVVVVARKDSNEDLLEMVKALGVDIEEIEGVKTKLEKEMEESQKRLMERLKKSSESSGLDSSLNTPEPKKPNRFGF